MPNLLISSFAETLADFKKAIGLAADDDEQETLLPTKVAPKTSQGGAASYLHHAMPPKQLTPTMAQPPVFQAPNEQAKPSFFTHMDSAPQDVFKKETTSNLLAAETVKLLVTEEKKQRVLLQAALLKEKSIKDGAEKSFFLERLIQENISQFIQQQEIKCIDFEQSMQFILSRGSLELTTFHEREKIQYQQQIEFEAIHLLFIAVMSKPDKTDLDPDSKHIVMQDLDPDLCYVSCIR